MSIASNVVESAFGNKILMQEFEKKKTFLSTSIPLRLLATISKR